MQTPVSPHKNHNNYHLFEILETQEDLAARERRNRRIQKMKKEKARRLFLQKCLILALPILILILFAVLVLVKCTGSQDTPKDSALQQELLENESFSETFSQETEGPLVSIGDLFQEAMRNHMETLPEHNENAQPETQPVVPSTVYSASATGQTLQLGSEIVSENAILIDLDTDTILAGKAANAVISPASMTKVLTVLVAAEQIQESQLDDTFTITLDITDYSYVNDCSNAGFLENETVTVRDLFYGTILPSGADAALALAIYTAGSHEAFVDLMNQKIEALGLSDTAHMTNCVGLYDQEHHCTVYDMAMIMEAAIDNPICREVLGTRIYTTSSTAQHPEGIILSNWFIRRIEDKDTGGKVLGAKTGYVNQSGSCAVSYAQDHAGKQYLCVTAHASSSWRCIYDHVAIYKKFATGEAPAAN